MVGLIIDQNQLTYINNEHVQHDSLMNTHMLYVHIAQNASIDFLKKEIEGKTGTSVCKLVSPGFVGSIGGTITNPTIDEEYIDLIKTIIYPSIVRIVFDKE